MKTNYELYLRDYDRHNPNCVQDEDYETIDYEPCLDYRDAVKRAKALSKKVPFTTSHGLTIRQVQIAAYYEGEEAEEEYGTTYYLLWKETYENGKVLCRY